jgi:twitching motility protein PilJ
MVKTSRWVQFIPTLAGLLLALLLVAGAVIWSTGGAGSTGEAELGRLMALGQAARAGAADAATGDQAALDDLVGTLQELEELRRTIVRTATAAGPVRQILSDRDGWQRITEAGQILVNQQDALAQAYEGANQAQRLAPGLLSAVGNLAAAMPAATLQRNQTYLDRVELTVQGIQQDIDGLRGSDSPRSIARRLSDSEGYLDQILRGLAGEDTGLGVAAVSGGEAAANLRQARSAYTQLRDALGQVSGAAGALEAAAAARADLSAAAVDLFSRYRSEVRPTRQPLPFGLDSSLGLALLGGAVLVLLTMMLAYYRARDYRDAAEQHSDQNERNQQAILRLLDELQPLADGDLTVQATVTEDITGAIADSINYAIGALRDLVATITDSSILLDAASKQTEGTSRHLVRSSELQLKQLAAASESIAQMAISIEEVSGNAERCADVARHSVDVASKGGEAVSRTIDGMNTIRETIQETSKRIKRLGESSQEIGNIVELINDIAEQTNILALNASIQASMAGEAGRGFAVVADEVQRLAERSANATKQIEVLVSTIQSDTNEAVVSMERSTTDVVGGALLAENAGAALDEIDQVSNQFASLVHNISSSAREQAEAAADITRNMQVLRGIGNKTAQSTTATSSAISKLSELASQLRRAASGFVLPGQSSNPALADVAGPAADKVAGNTVTSSAPGVPPTTPGTPPTAQQRQIG